MSRSSRDRRDRGRDRDRDRRDRDRDRDRFSGSRSYSRDELRSSRSERDKDRSSMRSSEDRERSSMRESRGDRDRFERRESRDGSRSSDRKRDFKSSSGGGRSSSDRDKMRASGSSNSSNSNSSGRIRSASFSSSSGGRSATAAAAAATAAPGATPSQSTRNTGSAGGDLAAKKKKHIDKIREIDGQLKVAEEQLQQLLGQRKSALTRSMAADQALMTQRLRDISDRITKENRAVAAQCHARAPQVLSAAAGDGVANSPVIKQIVADAPAMRPRVERWVRQAKLVVYKRSRILGETYAKKQPVWLRARKKELMAGAALGGSDQAFMSPNTGTIRLDNDAAFQEMDIDDARFDDTLAPDVPQVMDARLHGRCYTYNDRNYLVKDPVRANHEWNQRHTWNDDERKAFLKLYRKHHKKFHVISTMSPFHARDAAPKSTRDVVAFYYANKHRLGLKDLGPGGARRKPSHLSERAAPVPSRSPNTPTMPRELLNLGITSDEEFVAYLVGQNTSSRRRRDPSKARRQLPDEAPPSPPKIISAKRRKKKPLKEEDEPSQNQANPGDEPSDDEPLIAKKEKKEEQNDGPVKMEIDADDEPVKQEPIEAAVVEAPVADEVEAEAAAPSTAEVAKRPRSPDDVKAEADATVGADASVAVQAARSPPEKKIKTEPIAEEAADQLMK